MKSPHTVLHVLGTGEESGTAIANVVMGLAAHMDPARYSFSAFFLNSDGPLRADLDKAGVTIVDGHWTGGWRDPGGARRFAGMIRSSRSSIVHFHAGGMSARAAVKTVSRAAVIAHFHSLAREADYTNPHKRRAPFADLVIANSRATADTFRDDDVVVVPPGVDVRPETNRRHRSATVVIGVAARLVRVKRIDDLIDAMRIALVEAPTLRLEIAGTGPDEARLREKAKGLGETVRFLRWRRDVRTLMERWDIYAQPSLAEGFGLAVLEAMATGLPVVASNTGGLAELVLHDRTGFLVPPRDPRAIANRLVQLARDHHARDMLGMAGRERAARSFTLEQQAERMNEAYERVLA